MIRLVADANLSRRFVEACLRLDKELLIVHLADWMGGKHRISKDPILLEALREHGMILISFDRRTMAMHAGLLTRSGGGHTGVILFRRSVSQMDYGKQSRLVVEFWKDARDWDWSDRIEYFLRTGQAKAGLLFWRHPTQACVWFGRGVCPRDRTNSSASLLISRK